MGIALSFVISAHASWMLSSPRSRNSGETWGTRRSVYTRARLTVRFSAEIKPIALLPLC